MYGVATIPFSHETTERGSDDPCAALESPSARATVVDRQAGGGSGLNVVAVAPSSIFHAVPGSSMDKIETKRLTYEHQGRKIYEWEQSLEELHVYIDVPPGVRAKLLAVKIAARQLTIGLKGNPPFMDVSMRPCA